MLSWCATVVLPWYFISFCDGKLAATTFGQSHTGISFRRSYFLLLKLYYFKQSVII